MAKKDYKAMSTKKKSRKLFFGMLGPLLTITIVACTFFYDISYKIIEYYLKAELSHKSEQLNSKVLEQMSPVNVNIENFAYFAQLADEPPVLQALVNALSQNLKYASMFYYATSIPRNLKGGLFINNIGWEAPDSFDPTTRGWFTSAVKNKGQITYSDPYIDYSTGELAVTMSLTVQDSNGKVKGVVACDILLSKLFEITDDVTISKSGKVELINHDGLYMTNKDTSKIMKANYFAESAFKGDKTELLNNGLQTKVNRKNYFSVCPIGNSPWYIVIEGPTLDFTAQLSNTIIIFELALIIFSIICSVYNIFVIKSMRKNEQELGAKLFEETQNLVVAAKENAATSQDQSAAVKEIVATMEDSNALSESISSKINDVSKVAGRTCSDVAEGVSSIEQTVSQLHAIFNANQQTIDGMRELSDRIESIWDIVTLINNVADQAKIIAFNAELEASSAGEAGKSFRIVANEIRRLSDGIIDGTKEIKEKITEIQQSSDSLILASESGTQKINEGYENAKSLSEKFESIKNSAEVTASSASDITSIIQQQTSASEQILIALKQISAGVENFTVATDNISVSSEHIQLMSEQMNNSVKSSDDERRKRK